MGLAALLRRTNRIIHHPERGISVKIYRDFPYTVVPQVALGLRPWRALHAEYRCRTEKRKVASLQEAGFPLAQEYLYFEVSKYEPMVIMRYAADFMTVEDKLRQGMTREEAFALVGRCAAQLKELHQVRGRSTELTHGDPYLENARYYANGSVRWFDFEHEHRCTGSDARAMDGAIFLGHAFQVLGSCGQLQSTQDRADLKDAIEQYYPGLRTEASRGRLYLWLRF